LYEGFGLPVLEAMRLGAPVITSSTSALPEVADDAGLLVDPMDEEAIADALRKALVDTDLAAALRARGRERAKRFGGAQFAAALADAYHLAMSGTGP
jgi:glycosyltransferase involved in cell wall biosynthesis